MRYGEERGLGRRADWRREELEREIRMIDQLIDRPELERFDERFQPTTLRTPVYGWRTYGREEERGFFDRLRTFLSQLGEQSQQHRQQVRGPKGWKRSDERILQDICENIDEHGMVDASEVTVRVENAEVVLEGTVQTRRDKRLLEDIVDHVRGVVDIHNHLRLKEVGDKRGRRESQIS